MIVIMLTKKKNKNKNKQANKKQVYQHEDLNRHLHKTVIIEQYYVQINYFKNSHRN
jgi:hypothetical protein